MVILKGVVFLDTIIRMTGELYSVIQSCGELADNRSVDLRRCLLG